MMSEIYDSNEREHIHHRLRFFTGEEIQAYVETLEEIARLANVYLTNSTPANAVLLDAALKKVDRMRG